MREIIALAAPALPSGEFAGLMAAAEMDRSDDRTAQDQDRVSAEAGRTITGQAEPTRPSAMVASGLVAFRSERGEPVAVDASGLEPAEEHNSAVTAGIGDAGQRVSTATTKEEVDAAVQRAVDAVQIMNERQRADAEQREAEEYRSQMEATQDRDRAGEHGAEGPTAGR